MNWPQDFHVYSNPRSTECWVDQALARNDKEQIKTTFGNFHQDNNCHTICNSFPIFGKQNFIYSILHLVTVGPRKYAIPISANFVSKLLSIIA